MVKRQRSPGYVLGLGSEPGLGYFRGAGSERRLDGIFIAFSPLAIARIENSGQANHAVVGFLHRVQISRQPLALGDILQLARSHVHFGGLLRCLAIQNLLDQLMLRAKLSLHEPEIFG